MKIALDSSVIIDHLRGDPKAAAFFEAQIAGNAEFVSSMVIRTEVLAGMRPSEEAATRAFLGLILWEPVTEAESEVAGGLGRSHLPANQGIETPDLLLAAVAQRLGADLKTMNIKHFAAMFPDLTAPY